MTVADHNEPESAQKGTDHAGKVLRIRDDGTVPADNPFAQRAGYRPEIFTVGNRNPHGIAIHPDTGEIWENEHGDEVNILKPGGNYGWPYVSIGGEGGGAPIALPPKGLELTGPFVGWYPALNISGMTFYTGDKFPKWKGNLFLGTLNNEQIHRVMLGKDGAETREDLFTVKDLQVRDVRQDPDGLIYYTSFREAGPGQLLRIEPAQ